MNEPIPFPPDRMRRPGGSGPEDPMLERRVEILEASMGEVKASLNRLELSFARIEGALTQLPKATDLASLRAELGELKGRVAGLPTAWQLLTMVIATWAAGATIVFTILRFGVK